SSISRRFSSDSALKIWTISARSMCIGSTSEAPDPGRPVVGLKDQLAAASAFDVHSGDRNPFFVEHLSGHIDVLGAEMPAAALPKGGQHARPAKELGLKRVAMSAGRDHVFDERAHRNIAETRRRGTGGRPMGKEKMIDASDAVYRIPDADRDTRAE